MKDNWWILVWDTLNFQKMLVAHFSSKMPTGSHDSEVKAQSNLHLVHLADDYPKQLTISTSVTRKKPTTYQQFKE